MTAPNTREIAKECQRMPNRGPRPVGDGHHDGGGLARLDLLQPVGLQHPDDGVGAGRWLEARGGRTHEASGHLWQT